jgi:hypothetical protein
MAVDADIALISRYNTEGRTYHVLYYFNANGLFLVALVPKSIEDGFKTSKLLDAKDGAADREEHLGRNEDYVGGCIVRRRWGAPRWLKRCKEAKNACLRVSERPSFPRGKELELNYNG